MTLLARARTGTAEGAAVRDTDGGTYAATTVVLPGAVGLQVAVAMAGVEWCAGLEAAAVVTGAPSADEAGVAAVCDLAPKAPVFVAGADGSVHSTVE